MKQLLFVIPFVFALAGCSQDGFGSSKSTSSASAQPAAPPTTSKAAWQAVTVTGSATQPDDIVKINVLTGAAWLHCCGTSNTVFTAIKDGTQLPLGDYHLISWAQVAANGDVNYNVYRFDNATGHTWAYVPGSNGAASYWNDINAMQ